MSQRLKAEGYIQLFNSHCNAFFFFKKKVLKQEVPQLMSVM